MKLTILLAITVLVAYVDCHARLADPVGRQSIWRLYDDLPWTEELEWCYDPEIFQTRNVKCGVCGPIYNNNPASSVYADGTDLYSFERTSPLYSGRIAKTYQRGSTIQVSIEVEVMHWGGPVRFAVVDAAYADPTQQTLNRNLLTFTNGATSMDMKQGVKNRQMRTFSVRLPANLTCEHCILQWFWASREGRQDYVGCADVRIV